MKQPSGDDTKLLMLILVISALIGFIAVAALFYFGTKSGLIWLG